MPAMMMIGLAGRHISWREGKSQWHMQIALSEDDLSVGLESRIGLIAAFAFAASLFDRGFRGEFFSVEKP
jgi:hypothetical protein